MHKLYGFINTKGEEIIEPKFKFVSNFQEGLAQVEIIQNNFINKVMNFHFKLNLIKKSLFKFNQNNWQTL